MLSLGFKLLLINCFYGCFPLNAQDFNTSSIEVTHGWSPLNAQFLNTSSTQVTEDEEYCRTRYGETVSCPPFQEDIFYFLHNYTNPRPITVEEIEQVTLSCLSRVSCCRESWNMRNHLFEITGCFCYHVGDCAEYNVTSNHSLYKKHMQKVYPTFAKSSDILIFKLNWHTGFPFKISLIVLYSIVGIWGLTGNILVLITIFHFVNRESVTNIFIANLSFGDILVIGFALPFSALNRILDIWLWADWLCKSIWLVYYTSLMVSSFTMTAMAIERYLVICHPMKAHSISTPGRAKKIIATIWIAAISLSCVIMFFISGDLSKDIDCGLVYGVNSRIILYYILVVAFMVPLMIMIIAYVKVGVSLHQSVKEAKAMRGDTDSCHQDQQNFKMDNLSSRIEVVKMLVVVMVTFVITWLPSMIFIIMDYHRIVVPYGKFIGETRILLKDVVAMLTLLTFINSCLNPVFYALYSKSFREGFSKCFTCCCQKKKKRLSVSNLSTSTTDTRISRTPAFIYKETKCN